MGKILKDLFAIYTGLETSPVEIKQEQPKNNKWDTVLGLINHIQSNRPTTVSTPSPEESEIEGISSTEDTSSPETGMTIEEQAHFMDSAHNLSQGLRDRLQNWRLNFKPYSTKVKQFNLSQSNAASVEGGVHRFGSNDGKVRNSLYAFNYLVNKGLRPEVVAGIVGNLYHENIANPNGTVSDSNNTTSFGIACFNSKGELKGLKNFAKAKNLDINSIDTQLDYIYGKVKTNRAFDDPNITPEDASFYFGRDFEKFRGSTGTGFNNRNDSEHTKRGKTSRQLYDAYRKHAQ